MSDSFCRSQEGISFTTKLNRPRLMSHALICRCLLKGRNVNFPEDGPNGLCLLLPARFHTCDRRPCLQTRFRHYSTHLRTIGGLHSAVHRAPQISANCRAFSVMSNERRSLAHGLLFVRKQPRNGLMKKSVRAVLRPAPLSKFLKKADEPMMDSSAISFATAT